MRYVLDPCPIPEIWTLAEVLHWAAFRIYPIGVMRASELEWSKADRENYWPHPKWSSTSSSNLRPKASLLLNEEQLASLGDDPEDYVKFLYQGISDDDIAQDIALERLNDPTDIIVNALNEKIERAKADMITNLIGGSLKAQGELRHAEPKTQSILETEKVLECRRPIDSKNPFDFIPTKYWRPDMVDWERALLSTSDGIFGKIHFLIDNVTKAYPEPKGHERVIEFRDGTLLMDSNVKPPSSKSGRPAKYDWDAFHIEISSIMQTKGLPKTQSILEKQMLEWFQKIYGYEPSPSLVRRRLKLYYDRFSVSE